MSDYKPGDVVHLYIDGRVLGPVTVESVEGDKVSTVAFGEDDRVWRESDARWRDLDALAADVSAKNEAYKRQRGEALDRRPN